MASYVGRRRDGPKVASTECAHSLTPGSGRSRAGDAPGVGRGYRAHTQVCLRNSPCTTALRCKPCEPRSRCYPLVVCEPQPNSLNREGYARTADASFGSKRAPRYEATLSYSSVMRAGEKEFEPATRGFFVHWRLGQVSGPTFFLGKAVRLARPGHLHLGRAVFIGDGYYPHSFSLRGVCLGDRQA